MRIGIDIGGTKIKAELINNGKTIKQISAKTPKNKNDFIKILADFFTTLDKNKKINAIQIGCAGAIRNTKVISSRNISYLKNFDFRNIFKPPLRLSVDNDARFFLKNRLRTIECSSHQKIIAFTIGTGIGRAYAKNGKIQKIKKFEYSEIWEKKYQKIRDARNNTALIQFLAKKLAPIVKKYKPNIIILTGGVIQRKNFFSKIKKEFFANGINAAIKKL